MTNSLHDHLYDIAHFIDEPKYSAVMLEAADRIETLEAALRKISAAGDQAMPSPNLSKEAANLWVCFAVSVDIARAALAGEKKE